MAVSFKINDSKKEHTGGIYFRTSLIMSNLPLLRISFAIVRFECGAIAYHHNNDRIWRIIYYRFAFLKFPFTYASIFSRLSLRKVEINRIKSDQWSTAVPFSQPWKFLTSFFLYHRISWHFSHLDRVFFFELNLESRFKSRFLFSPSFFPPYTK